MDDGWAFDVRRIRGRRSRVVLARPCRRQVRAKLQRPRADDGGNQLVHRGELGVSRKPLRREGRSDSACTCGLRAFRATFCARAHGCSAHPAFPAPSCFLERVTQDAKLGRMPSRGRGTMCLQVIRGLSLELNALLVIVPSPLVGEGTSMRSRVFPATRKQSEQGSLVRPSPPPKIAGFTDACEPCNKTVT